MGKLNELFKNWPSGTVVLQPWLLKRQIVRQLANKYVAGGWMTKIGTGAYIKAGDQVNWQGGVYALQKQLDQKIHVGGLTALELLGRAHFIPLGNNHTLYIYVHGRSTNRYLSKWLTEYFKSNKFIYISKLLFSTKVGLHTVSYGSFDLICSTPERALLETLALVPKKISFNHAYLLMEGQDTLRVDLLQSLLNDCRSYLLKRLFLHLAKKCQLPWLERLNLNIIKLGQGKRQIGSGTYYDPEFKLLLPIIKKVEDPLL